MKSFLHMLLIIVIAFIISKVMVNYYAKNHPNNAVASVNQGLISDIEKEIKDDNEVNSAHSRQNTNQITLEKKSINEITTESNEFVSNDIMTEIRSDDIVLGNRNSNVVIIEYFSFTCPHCAFYHQKIFPEIQKKYIDTNKIVYVIREFIGNKQDFEASILARCSNDQNKFLQFQDILLKQQNDWIFDKKFRDILTNIGQLGSISSEDFDKCLKDPSIAEMLLSQSRLTTKIKNFPGTPTFIINGKLTMIPELIDTIEQALNNQKI